MREVVACIHPICIHGAQILNLQLDQGSRQLCLVSQTFCKAISLELVSSAKDIHQELDDGIHRRQSVRKQDKADYDRELLVEAERLVERFVVDKHRE